MSPKSRKRPKVKSSEEKSEEGYSLWNPPPGWMDKPAFGHRRNLVDPNVTPEQIKEAVEKARNDPRMKAFTATMTPEQMMRPVCGPGEPAPSRKPPKPSEEWLQGFREGRAAGAMSERIRIARMAYAEGNPIAEKLDPSGMFSPVNDPEHYGLKDD